MLRRLWIGIVLTALVSVPVLIWFGYKPSRVFVPSLAPVECAGGRVCVDTPQRRNEAQALYDEAFAFVSQRYGKFEVPPRVYFCSTKTCSDYFGWDGTAGYNIGVFGMVIKPKGWVAHIVRHEMLHHLQNERLGLIAAYYDKPAWFLEGMAYALSEDPRRPLRWSPKLEADRARFEEWYTNVGAENLWEAARNLTRHSP